MALQFGNTKIGEMQYNGLNIAEAMYNGEIVFRGGYALPKSAPDYWYSMEDGGHYYNRGSRDEWLRFREGTSFANRGDYAYSNSAAPYIHVEESWEDGFTMAGWFHITAYSEWSYFFARGASGSDRRIYVVATSPSDSSPRSVALRVEAQGEGLSSWVRGPANIIPESGFFHLALTWRYDGQNISNVYVNGVSVWEMLWDQSRPRLSFTPDQWVSYVEASPDTGYKLHANLDDIAMWSRPLADAEIAAIHRDGRVPTDDIEPAPPYQESVERYASPGQAALSVPEWAREMDYILLGAGGGGRNGDGGIAVSGGGGGAGSYTSGTLAVRPGESLSSRVGRHGRGTSQHGASTNQAGESSYLSMHGQTVASAAGGARGSGTGNHSGLSPGNHSYEGLSIMGGAEVGQNTDGNPPGGGGGGGSGGFFGSFSHGRPGGDGEIVVRFRSAPR